MPRIDMYEAREMGLIDDGDWAIASGDDGRHEADPGHVGPFDLCMYCYMEWSFKTDVEHPDYDDGDYRCRYCNRPLSQDLDGLWLDNEDIWKEVDGDDKGLG
jgi:hypothetical protein